MFKKFTEADYVNDFIKKLGNNYNAIYTEIPYMGRSIDMVILDKGKIITIEFKLHNWKKAIQQACDHKLGSDESYILLPDKETTRRNLKLANELEYKGIGLMLYNPNSIKPLEIAVKPKQLESRWRKWKDSMLSILNKIKPIVETV